MDKEAAIKHLHSMKWNFAKSMPKIPHWYARRREFGDFFLFEQVAVFIKENGKKEPFYRKTYSYFYDDKFKYWIMDDDPKDAEIINRAES